MTGFSDMFRKKSNAKKQSVPKNYLGNIHSDIEGLLWFADGQLKNYINENDGDNTFDYNGVKVNISMPGYEEPSLIYTKQEIVPPGDIFSINKAPHFPRYFSLTPEQKGLYLKLLENPYNSDIDIGFVFLLYYGLERHLLVGDYGRAYKAILNLRRAHSNSSFQGYSARTLLFSSLLHNQEQAAIDFLNSLGKSISTIFSADIFLMCCFRFGISVGAKDIMCMARAFDFSNLNYIKKYPDVFSSILEELLVGKYGSNSIFISDLINGADVSKLSIQECSILANTSLRDAVFPVPMFSESLKLKEAFNGLLETTHKLVKVKVSELRKAGVLQAVEAPKPPKTLPVFDAKEEKMLLDALASGGSDLVGKHFIYSRLQDFYYKYRVLDGKYLSLCIEYCLKDIKDLKRMEKQYVANEIMRQKQWAEMDGKKFTQSEAEKIKEEGFIGIISAFKRLVIIYERQQRYEEAIAICDIAITFKREEFEYTERKKKIQKMMNKG